MRPSAATLVALLGLAAAAAGCRRAERPQGPNVVLVSIDTLRADHVGAYGYARPTTPHIDRLAQEGTTFTRAYAASSWTVPSHMTMLTGLPPSLHGVDRPGRRLDPARVTLAERFQAAGWDTAAFVTGPTLHAAFGFDQGFARYDNTMDFTAKDFADGDPTVPASRALHRSHQVVTGPTVRSAVERWMDRDADPPFFLFVHLWDPHYDYIPPPPYDTRFDPDYRGTFDFSNFDRNSAINASMPEREKARLVALYDGEIAATDAVVGELLAALEQHGWGRSTLVVLTSDHGEEFFEHGRKGHMKTLFEEVTHVPLVVWFPGQVPAGQRVDEVVDAVHLMPTMLGFAGLRPGDDAHGRDLSAALRGGSPLPADLWAFSELAHARDRPLYAVRTRDRTLIGERGGAEVVDVYERTADAREQSPRGASDAERTLFTERLAAATTRPHDLARSEGDGRPLDPETVRQLEALGYLRE